MKKTLYNILTVFVLIMAIIQAPLFYYYTFGLMFLFYAAPYLLVGLGLTIWLLVMVLENKNSQITLFQKRGLILIISIGCFSLFFGESIIEKIDWELRRDTREEIIELIKADKLKPNVTYNDVVCTLDKWNFPPISNGGNEIVIYKKDNNLTVEFFIDRGFLDHYSAFVYTNDTEEIKEIERYMSYKKLDEHWYRVSY